jgi:ankyrin repeat protein
MPDPVLNDSGMTELHLAAYHGDPGWVAACIAGGLDVNARAINGFTPLHWAVDMGCVGNPADRAAVVRALVAAGADRTAVDIAGQSVADRAVFCTSEYLLPYLDPGAA